MIIWLTVYLKRNFYHLKFFEYIYIKKKYSSYLLMSLELKNKNVNKNSLILNHMDSNKKSIQKLFDYEYINNIQILLSSSA